MRTDTTYYNFHSDDSSWGDSVLAGGGDPPRSERPVGWPRRAVLGTVLRTGALAVAAQ